MPFLIDLQGIVIISDGNCGLGFAISKLVAKSGGNVTEEYIYLFIYNAYNVIILSILLKMVLNTPIMY